MAKMAKPRSMGVSPMKEPWPKMAKSRSMGVSPMKEHSQDGCATMRNMAKMAVPRFIR